METQSRYLRKQSNVVDEKRIEVKDRLEKQIKDRERERKRRRGETIEEEKKTALDRFQ
jgi:hypothetical protein